MSTLTPAIRNALRWPARMTVSEWADASIVLGEDSAEPGPYRVGRTPYAREWQDSASCPWVRQVTIMCSTQVGKTQSLLNVLGYAIAQDPGPITWVMPTAEDAKEFAENRVQPLVQLSPALRAQQTGERFDEKKRQMRFRRARILFRSANVPKELAGYPARWLFGDEASKWPSRTRDEAPPFELARERTRTFWNHKIYLDSTPKHPDDLIVTEFARGDRRRFHVPCPHCRRVQVLQWGQVRWPSHIQSEDVMRKERSAWYECLHCKGHIEDRHKFAMLDAGFWCPEDIDPEAHLVDGRFVLEADRTPHRSYHIWAGYSPWLTWWEIVAERLRAEHANDLQNFINSWLGEPWVDRIEEPKPELLQQCITGYQHGDVPEGVLAITAGVDVQKRFLVFSIRGWGLDMESWLLDHGRVDNFDQLEAALLARAWPRGLRLVGAFVDANYRTDEVIDFARKYPQVLKPCRGVELDDPRPFSASRMEMHPRTGQLIGLKITHINVGMFKDRLSHHVRTGGAGGKGSFHIYGDVDELYLNEMASEHKIRVKGAQRDRERWVKKTGHNQNHYWDTEVYSLAMADLWHVQNMRATVERQQTAQAVRRKADVRKRRPQSRGFGGETM